MLTTVGRRSTNLSPSFLSWFHLSICQTSHLSWSPLPTHDFLPSCCIYPCAIGPWNYVQKCTWLAELTRASTTLYHLPATAHGLLIPFMWAGNDINVFQCPVSKPTCKDLHRRWLYMSLLKETAFLVVPNLIRFPQKGSAAT